MLHYLTESYSYTIYEYICFTWLLLIVEKAFVAHIVILSFAKTVEERMRKTSLR